MGILELFAEFSRLVSFTFRLFGNIFAGEVLLVVIAFLVPYIAPIPFLGLEIFVGFIQALVFAMLTLVFLKMAMTAHGHDDTTLGLRFLMSVGRDGFEGLIPQRTFLQSIHLSPSFSHPSMAAETAELVSQTNAILADKILPQHWS